MQHVQPDTQANSAYRLRAFRQRDQGCAPQQKAIELEPVRRHVVLPARSGAFLARNRRRTHKLRGQAHSPRHRSPRPVRPVLRQQSPPLGAVRESLLRPLRHCRRKSRRQKKKFRFKNKRVSLDSTLIDLCLSMYAWTKFRRAKGAVKPHLILDHDGYPSRTRIRSRHHPTDLRCHGQQCSRMYILAVSQGFVIQMKWQDRAPARTIAIRRFPLQWRRSNHLASRQND